MSEHFCHCGKPAILWVNGDYLCASCGPLPGSPVSCEAERLRNLLAHDRLRALTNYGDRWGISHVSFDGESIAEIFDDSFDRLIETWERLLESLEA